MIKNKSYSHWLNLSSKQYKYKKKTPTSNCKPLPSCNILCVLFKIISVNNHRSNLNKDASDETSQNAKVSISQ